MTQKNSKIKRIVCVSSVAFIVALFIVLNICCFVFYPYVNAFLTKPNVDSVLREEGQALAVQVEQEGIVLAKNDDKTLPLPADTSKINVFGWSATQWIRSGDGSGRSGTNAASVKVNLLKALENHHIAVNENMIDAYQSFRATRDNFTSLDSTNEEYSRLYEPSINDTSIFPKTLLNAAKTYSDVALVVLGRRTGESNDCPKVQYKQTEKDGDIRTDLSRTYLDISTEEEELLNYVAVNYQKVIVIVNSTNTMNLGFMDQIDNLDACLIVGGTGAYGATAIPRILLGEITPSGRTTDTYAYDLKSNPSYATSAGEGLGYYTDAEGLYPTTVIYGSDGKGKKFPNVAYSDYLEDIYIGYKWYETADKEGYWKNVEKPYGKGYDGVVQYPFGYGLSYTDFEWELIYPLAGTRISSADTKIELQVRVTNIGEMPGQDVVQIYYEPLYTPGGIEKSSANLVAFGKTTAILEPGESEVLTLSFTASDMANYDSYDRNGNGFAGYELESGTYAVKLMNNAHELGKEKNGNNVLDFTVSSGIQIKKDGYSGNDVKNRFTGEGISDGISIDGNEGRDYLDSSVTVNYLTRKNFAKTFPVAKAENRAMTKEIAKYNVYTKALNNEWEEKHKTNAPVTVGVDNGLSLFDDNVTPSELALQLGADYDDTRWNLLLDQLRMPEMKNLVLHGYSTVKACPSIGLPAIKATDGPSQIGSWGSIVAKPDESTTAFPIATVLAQTWNPELAYTFGLSMGKEANEVGISCWYGPGINLHRHPFGGRNYEYWSEDGYISGVMCGQAVKGAKNAGVYSTIKHLALYNTDTYRDGQYVWLTEQNLRESYLKAFKLAIQKGGATGLMTSYNRIGAVWTGGSYALQTEIIREEFGFEGLIITDYCDHIDINNMMLGDSMLRAGGDLWMDGFNNPGKLFYDTSSSSNAFRQSIRTASKNVIYAYLNAVSTNIEYNKSGEDVIEVDRGREGTPWWVFVLIASDAVALLGSAFWVYVSFFHKKRQKMT